MKDADLHIGLEFFGGGAVRASARAPSLQSSLITMVRSGIARSPYVAKEVVFDEQEIERCDLTGGAQGRNP
ncbi:hypothetical protein [Paraburkholderia caffeinilytica]|uniref:hypothetical protein n=1 Tax=Paraburkholderia caffeinilytica TaxID=1761016 RepID=UPI003DA09BAA